MIRKNLKHNSVFQYNQTHKTKAEQKRENLFFAMLSKNGVLELTKIGNVCHKIIRKFMTALHEYFKKGGLV